MITSPCTTLIMRSCSEHSSKNARSRGCSTAVKQVSGGAEENFGPLETEYSNYTRNIDSIIGGTGRIAMSMYSFRADQLPEYGSLLGRQIKLPKRRTSAILN